MFKLKKTLPRQSVPLAWLRDGWFLYGPLFALWKHQSVQPMWLGRRLGEERFCAKSNDDVRECAARVGSLWYWQYWDYTFELYQYKCRFIKTLYIYIPDTVVYIHLKRPDYAVYYSSNMRLNVVAEAEKIEPSYFKWEKYSIL